MNSIRQTQHNRLDGQAYARQQAQEDTRATVNDLAAKVSPIARQTYRKDDRGNLMAWDGLRRVWVTL